MIRILKFIPGSYPTSRPDVAALFGRYLPRFGIQTDLVAQAGIGWPADATEWDGGRVILWRRVNARIANQLLGFFHDLRALWQSGSGAYDAIQVRDKVFVAVVAIWAARLRRIPFFYWMSFPMSEVYIKLARERGRSLGTLRWAFLLGKGHLGKLLLYKYVLKRCAHVFVQSDRMIDDVVTQGVPRSYMTAVPMGVDCERTFPTRADARRDVRLTDRRVVAYLGSFERFRQLDFLLDVMQQVATTIPDAALLMIGDSTEPGDRRLLEERAVRLGIADRIVWTGWIEPAEAWQWLVNADVAVSFIPRGPAYDCASPTKVVEYLALGIPVVANDQPDQKRVIEESGAGICCEMVDTEVVAGIVAILDNAALANAMRAAGPAYVSAERGYDRISERVAGVYQQYCGTADRWLTAPSA